MKDINEVRDYLVKHRTDKFGDLDLSNLDFSNFDGNIYISGMKVKNDLFQMGQLVRGDLYQNSQIVKGYLYQGNQKVEGSLYQDNQVVEEYLVQDNIPSIKDEVNNSNLKENTKKEMLDMIDNYWRY